VISSAREEKRKGPSPGPGDPTAESSPGSDPIGMWGQTPSLSSPLIFLNRCCVNGYADFGTLEALPNKRMQQTARVFKRKVIAFMRRDETPNGLGHLARWLVTPQLMRRAVRQPPRQWQRSE
jgi:hypothetical protein